MVHLLYASPIQRGAVSVIEDLPPLYNTRVVVDFDEKIQRAYLIPSGQNISMESLEGKMELIVPEFTCHTALVLEY